MHVEEVLPISRANHIPTRKRVRQSDIHTRVRVRLGVELRVGVDRREHALGAGHRSIGADPKRAEDGRLGNVEDGEVERAEGAVEVEEGQSVEKTAVGGDRAVEGGREASVVLLRGRELAAIAVVSRCRSGRGV